MRAAARERKRSRKGACAARFERSGRHALACFRLCAAICVLLDGVLRVCGSAAASGERFLIAITTCKTSMPQKRLERETAPHYCHGEHKHEFDEPKQNVHRSGHHLQRANCVRVNAELARAEHYAFAARAVQSPRCQVPAAKAASSASLSVQFQLSCSSLHRARSAANCTDPQDLQAPVTGRTNPGTALGRTACRAGHSREIHCRPPFVANSSFGSQRDKSSDTICL